MKKGFITSGSAQSYYYTIFKLISAHGNLQYRGAHIIMLWSDHLSLSYVPLTSQNASIFFPGISESDPIA